MFYISDENEIYKTNKNQKTHQKVKSMLNIINWHKSLAAEVKRHVYVFILYVTKYIIDSHILLNIVYNDSIMIITM